MGIKRRGSQKRFPKSVRSNAVGRFGVPIASSPAQSPERSRHRSGFAHRTRQLSNSVKSMFSSLIHRGQSSSIQIPEQQLEASRPHFNDNRSPTVPDVSLQSSDLLHDSSSAEFNHPNRPFNIGSVNSHASTWTDSSAHGTSAAGTFARSQRSEGSKNDHVSRIIQDLETRKLAWKLMEKQRDVADTSYDRPPSPLISRLPQHLRADRVAGPSSMYSRSTSGKRPDVRTSSARTRGHRRENAQIDDDETDYESLGRISLKMIHEYPKLKSPKSISTVRKGKERHETETSLGSRSTHRMDSGSAAWSQSQRARQASMTPALSEEADDEFEDTLYSEETEQLYSRDHTSINPLREFQTTPYLEETKQSYSHGPTSLKPLPDFEITPYSEQMKQSYSRGHPSSNPLRGFETTPYLEESKQSYSRGYPSSNPLQDATLTSRQYDWPANEDVNPPDPFTDFSSYSLDDTQHHYNPLVQRGYGEGGSTTEHEARSPRGELPVNHGGRLRENPQSTGAHRGVNFSRNVKRDAKVYYTPENNAGYDTGIKQYSLPYASHDSSMRLGNTAPDQHLREKYSFECGSNSPMSDVYKRANDRYSPERERRLHRQQYRGPGGVDENFRGHVRCRGFPSDQSYANVHLDGADCQPKVGSQLEQDGSSG